MRVGGFDQDAGGSGRVGDRLLDHDIQAELHQPAADLGMRHGGRGDDGGVRGSGEFLQRLQTPGM